MKLNYHRWVTLVLLTLVITASSSAQAGIFNAIVTLDNGTEMWSVPCYDLQNYELGFFTNEDTLALKGGEIHTYNNIVNGNICGANLHYRLFKECEPPEAFSAINLNFCCAQNNADCEGGICGIANAGAGVNNKKWHDESQNINLLTNLSQGRYTLEIFASATGSSSGISTCEDSFLYDNNGLYYSAHFTVTHASFNQGNSNISSVWTGNIDQFSVLDPLSLSGDGSNILTIGPNGNNQAVLVSNVGATDAAVLTPSNQAYGVWKFSVATGLNWNTSAVNNFVVPFICDSNDPSQLLINSSANSPNYHGYAIKLKNSAGNQDRFVLIRQDGNNETEILDLQYPLMANAYHGYSFKIARGTDGEFQVYCDEGFNVSDATTLRGTVQDNTHQVCSNFALVLNANNGGIARRLYFDNLQMYPATEIQFENPLLEVVEGDVDFVQNIAVSIANPDDRCPVSADLVLLDGNNNRIGNFAGQNIMFPAGSSISITVPLTISGNDICERNENLHFTLQNIQGGKDALLGESKQQILHVMDDESATVREFSDSFETGADSRWINLDHWSLTNSSATLSGAFDLKHENGGLAARDCAVADLNKLELQGVETSWKFKFKHGGINTSSNNWLMVVLAANQTQIWEGNNLSPTLNGYAVGVNFNTPDDRLKLVRIDQGTVVDLIVSDYLWANNVGLNVEVVRDENGMWDFSFQEITTPLLWSNAGAVADNTYLDAPYLSFAVELTASNSGKPRVDDIVVEQYGCFEDWYSVSNGNTADAIWSQDPSSPTGSTLSFGRFKNLVIQSGDTVLNTQEVLAHNFRTDNNAVFVADSSTLVVSKDFTNNGLYLSNEDVVRFSPYNLGQIGGSSVSTLHHIVASGSGMLSLAQEVNLQGNFSLNRGTFDTNNFPFHLKSDSLSTASIAAIHPDAQWVGPIHLERYIAPGNSNWVNLGNPLMGATISDWNDDFTTTGFSGSDWPNYSFNNIVQYDEAAAGDLNQGFVGVTDTSDALASSQGYLVYLDGNEHLVEVFGEIQQGYIVQNLNFTPNNGVLDDGWNLVVNRYPSALDWELLFAQSAGVASTYYVHDGDGFSGTPNYLFYDALSGSGNASRYIASGQSFWVKTDAPNAQLIWSESVKTQVNSSFERGILSLPKIGIRLTGSTGSEDAYVVLNDSTTSNYDSQIDAFLLGNGGSSEESPVVLATLSENDYYLSVNNLPWTSEEAVIPVHIAVDGAQDLQLSVTEFTEIPESACLTILDLETEQVYALNGDTEISFSCDEAFAGIRFLIYSGLPLTWESQNLSCPDSNDGSVFAQVPSEGEFVYSWYDELGNLIASESSLAGSGLDDLPLGNYTVVVEGTSSSCGNISQGMYVDQPQEISVDFEYETDDCNSGQAWLELDTSENWEYEFELTNSEGALVFSDGPLSGNLFLEELIGQPYTASVQTACESITWSLDLTDPFLVTAEIEYEDTLLILEDGWANLEVNALVENADNVSWWVDGVWYSEQPFATLTFQTVGSYEITLVAGNPFCSASQTLTVEVVVIENTAELLAEMPDITIMAGSILVEGQGLAQPYTLDIFDSLGRRVYHTTSSNPVLKIDTESFSSGWYSIQVNGDGGFQAVPFVVD